MAAYDNRLGFGLARIKQEGTTFWCTTYFDIQIFPGELETAGLHKTHGRLYPKKNRQILDEFMELVAQDGYINDYKL